MRFGSERGSKPPPKPDSAEPAEPKPVAAEPPPPAPAAARSPAAAPCAAAVLLLPWMRSSCWMRLHVARLHVTSSR